MKLRRNIRDVSERKRVERALRETSRLNSLLLDSIPNPAVLVGPGHVVLGANKAALEIGVKIGELCWQGFCKGKYRNACLAEQALNQNETKHCQTEMYGRFWDTFWVPAAKETYLHYLVDITENKKTQETSTKLAAIVESSDDAITSYTFDGVVTSWNKGAERVYGYSAYEMIGHPASTVAPSDRPDEISRIIERIKRGERLKRFETERIRKDGRRIIVSLTTSPIKDSSGKLVGVSTIARDITERKLTEKALKERMKQLDCLCSISRLVDQQGRDLAATLKGVIFIIPSAWQFPDITCVRIVFGEKVFESSNFKETVWKQSAPIKVNGKNVGTVEVYYLEDKPVLFEGPFLREERVLIDAVAERLGRIIERVQAEEAVKRRLEVEQTISRVSSYFIGVSNIDDSIDFSLADMGRLSHASRAYMFLFSDDGEKMSNIHEWCDKGVIPQIDNLQNLPVNMFPWWTEKLIRGEIIHVPDASRMPEEARVERKILLEDQNIKSLLVLPLSISGKLGGFIGFDNVYHTEAWSENDTELLNVCSRIMGDAIEHKQMEDKIKAHAENLEKEVAERTKELREAERLSAIGKTAMMIGHDLRNPLQVVVNSLYLLRETLESTCARYPDNEETKGSTGLLDRVDKQVEYMNKIVSDLQDYARPLKPEFAETDLDQLITETLSTIRIPDTVEVSKVVGKDTPRVTVDPAMMKRVFTNLITNAIQAMPNGGQLAIRASKVEKVILISVQDTGAGIAKENIGKLFTPLFTTKAKGQGLGLPVCKRIAEAHGGEVTVESEEGKGSIFTVKLPIKME